MRLDQFLEKPAITPEYSLTHIIVDGAKLYAGHRWAWRRGVVIGPGRSGLVQVRLERRGRERRRPEAELAASWCMLRTLTLEATLRRLNILAGWDDAGEPMKEGLI
jgi:hypothetical protein